jgi:hypothetical protein
MRSRKFRKLVKASLLQRCLRLGTRMKMRLKEVDKSFIKIRSKCTMEVILMKEKFKSGRSHTTEAKVGKSKMIGLLLPMNFAKDKPL